MLGEDLYVDLHGGMGLEVDEWCLVARPTVVVVLEDDGDRWLANGQPSLLSLQLLSRAAVFETGRVLRSIHGRCLVVLTAGCVGVPPGVCLVVEECLVHGLLLLLDVFEGVGVAIAVLMLVKGGCRV